jgi:pyruvate,water dikinase
MDSLVVPLSAPEAADAKRFGPKAANLAALGRAGLPVPGGFAVDAGAYRAQLAALGLEATAREVFASGDRPRARRCALDMKLGLMESPVAPRISEPLLAAWRACGKGVVRSSALVEDRAGSSFAGQFESFLELQDEQECLLGGAVVDARAALHGDPRPGPRGYGDGADRAAARRGARLGRGIVANR